MIRSRAVLFAVLLASCHASHELPGPVVDAGPEDGAGPPRCTVHRAGHVTGCGELGTHSNLLGHVSDPDVLVGCACHVLCDSDASCQASYGPRAFCNVEWTDACFISCSSDADCPTGMRCFRAGLGGSETTNCLWPES